MIFVHRVTLSYRRLYPGIIKVWAPRGVDAATFGRSSIISLGIGKPIVRREMDGGIPGNDNDAFGSPSTTVWRAYTGTTCISPGSKNADWRGINPNFSDFVNPRGHPRPNTSPTCDNSINTTIIIGGAF